MSYAELSDAARKLADYMSEISEGCYSAGWMGGLEYALWGILLDGHGEYGMGYVDRIRVKRLQNLSDKCSGWIIWDDEADGETWVTRNVWEEMYKERCDARNAARRDVQRHADDNASSDARPTASEARRQPASEETPGAEAGPGDVR